MTANVSIKSNSAAGILKIKRNNNNKRNLSLNIIRNISNIVGVECADGCTIGSAWMVAAVACQLEILHDMRGCCLITTSKVLLHLSAVDDRIGLRRMTDSANGSLRRVLFPSIPLRRPFSLIFDSFFSRYLASNTCV